MGRLCIVVLGSSSLFHAGFEFEREGILDVGYQLYGSFSLLRRIALWFLRKVKVPLLLFFTLSCHHSLLAEGPVAQTQLVVQAAQQFLGLLNEEQKAQALFTLENPERENWHYVPMEREGLRIDAMDKKQQGAAHELLAQSLSAQGHLIANDSIRLEELLYKRSNQSDLRDPGKYTVALFGMPSLKKPWGWRFEGHHLSFNFTIVSDKVALATPFFVGTNPAEVRAGELKGLRPLGAIEDAARTLARSIHGDGLHVRYTNDPPREILTRQDRVAQKQATEGVAYSSLDGAYQKQLLKLVQLITANPTRFSCHFCQGAFRKLLRVGLGSLSKVSLTTSESRLRSSSSNTSTFKTTPITPTSSGVISRVTSAATS